MASTLLQYCIWYGTCSKADGEGLKALGYHLLTESDLSQLSERAGFRLHSIEVLKKVYDRLPAASRFRYLKWFERFDNAAKARLSLPRDEAEYAKKVALSNPGGGDLEVELIELALQVEREMEGFGPEQERRARRLEELDLEQQELGEPEQVRKDKNQRLSESEQEERQERCEPEQVCKDKDLSDAELDDPWAEACRRLKQEKEERMKRIRWREMNQKALFREPEIYNEGSDWEDYRK